VSGQHAVERFGDVLPEGAIARLGSVRFLHEDWVRHLAFLPGDRDLFGACGLKACLWHVDSGRLKTEFPRPDSSIMCAALSPDAKTVAIAENGNRIFLDDIPGGKLRIMLEGNTSRAHDLAWSPDSRRLAAGMGHTIFLWDAVSGQLLRRLKGDVRYFQAVVFSPSGKTLVGGDRKAIHLWNADTGEKLRDLEGRLDGSTLTFAPDGKSVVGPCNVPIGKNTSRSSLRRWDTDGKKFRDLAYGTFNCAAFSRDGRLLAAGEGLNIRLWDAVSGKELRHWQGHVGHVTALAFSSDGKTLASGGYDHRIRLWSVATGKELRPTPGHRGAVNGVAFSPNGKVIASAGLDATIRLWDWASGREIKRCDGVGTIALGEHWGARQVAFSPDGKTLVSMEANFEGPKLRLWSAKGDLLSRFGEPGFHASAVAFSPDNETVVAAYADTIAVFEPRKGKVLRSFKKEDYLAGLSLGPDGRKAAWIGQYRRPRPFGVFDLETGKDVFQTEKVSAGSLAFSPDGSVIATSEYESICLRSATTGHRVSEWKEPAGPLAFSPDGRLLAGATSRGFALWEVLAQQTVRHWRGHAGLINGLAFSPDGRLVVTASADGTLLVWDMSGLAKAAKRPLQLSDEDLKNHYADLTGADANKAHRAIWTLAAAAPKSLALVARHLHPVPNDPDKITRLIKELDDKSFAVRNKALADLIELGERAEPALRRTMVSAPPIEVQRRISAILGKLDPKALAVKWLHARRLLAVVEYAGTKEAGQMLERLAAGAPDAPLTRAAAAARKRLSR
jgi:WD40 repeat protein